MSSEATCPITLTVAGDPRLARLVRMTAANVGALCSMSVDRIEDIRMAAEEAFIFGCTAVDCDDITIKFDVDETHVGMTITFGDQATVDEGHLILRGCGVCRAHPRERANSREKTGGA
ncbi:MAG: ATP-binding protein [Collinsella sp.]